MINIAILMGGTSNESLISLKSANTILKHIDKKKYNAYKILCKNINQFYAIINSKKIKLEVENFSFSFNNQIIKFQKVFMIIHGAPGETGELCGYFESLNIPYTSCDEQTSKLTFNKLKCNHYLNQLNYKVPSSIIYKSNCKINFPCIVKPSCSGSSFGISKVSKKEDLLYAIQLGKQYGKEIIIEKFITGTEVTCAVYKSKNNIKTLPITEIVSENEIFDYDAKYNGKAKEITPARIEKKISEKIKNISKNIYIDLSLKGIIRIDFIINKTTPYIIEINTIPGFSEESIVPKMLKCANIDIMDFISEQIENI